MESLKRFAFAGCCLFGGINTAAAARAAEAGQAPAIENSVVKVFATMRYPDPFRPWTKQAPSEVTASGVVIEGRRILTNAHVVLYATQVQIQANAAGDKVPATVVAVAPGIDLAVLKLDDATFFDTHPPVARAASCRRSRMRSWPTASPPAAVRCPSPRGSCRASSSCPTTIRCPDCASRSMRPSIRQQRRSRHRGRQDGRAGLQQAGRRCTEHRLHHPNEEVELFLKDIADGRYDGKPPCTTNCRPWKIRRCAST